MQQGKGLPVPCHQPHIHAKGLGLGLTDLTLHPTLSIAYSPDTWYTAMGTEELSRRNLNQGTGVWAECATLGLRDNAADHGKGCV